MALDPLAQIDLIAIGAIILITLATLLLLRRLFFLPVIEVMERRAAKMQSAQARKAAGEAALKQAESEAEQVLAAAREQAARVAAQVQEDAARLRADRLARAGAEAEAILAQGREEVRALAQSEEARLQVELCACVSRTLARAIGTVDDSAVRYMVNRVLTANGAG